MLYYSNLIGLEPYFLETNKFAFNIFIWLFIRLDNQIEDTIIAAISVPMVSLILINYILKNHVNPKNLMDIFYGLKSYMYRDLN